jgi:rRNA maturation endonuclease Nob1
MQELQRLENAKEDKIVVAELNKRMIALKQEFEEFKENAVDPEEFKQVQEAVSEHGKQLTTQEQQLMVLQKETNAIHEKFMS